MGADHPLVTTGCPTENAMTSGSTGPLGALPGAPVGRLLDRVSRDAFPFEEPDPTVEFTARALPADRQAVREGRQFAGAILNRWALSPLVDNAALIVSERSSSSTERKFRLAQCRSSV